MGRRYWLVPIVIVLLTILAGCSLQANIKEEPRRVGILVGTDFRLAKLQGLEASLPDYGYIPGQNLELIVKNAKGNRQQLQPLAEELIAEGVEVIMTAGRVETEAAKEAARLHNVPVVFMGLTGIQEDGLVKDLLHPQEGLTGVHNDHAALSGKRLELLVKLLPQIKEVLVIYDPRVIPTAESLASTREAATKLSISLAEVPVATIEDIGAALRLAGDEVDAVLLLPSVFLESAGASTLGPLALERGLPVMGVEHSEEEKGFFAIFGITPFDQGYQAGRILAKILSGQRAEDIPVEPPALLRLTINLEVAEQLGLELESAMLGYADLLEREGGDSFVP